MSARRCGNSEMDVWWLVGPASGHDTRAVYTRAHWRPRPCPHSFLSRLSTLLLAPPLAAVSPLAVGIGVKVDGDCKLGLVVLGLAILVWSVNPALPQFELAVLDEGCVEPEA